MLTIDKEPVDIDLLIDLLSVNVRRTAARTFTPGGLAAAFYRSFTQRMARRMRVRLLKREMPAAVK